jgi:hypothetical protein
MTETMMRQLNAGGGNQPELNIRNTSELMSFFICVRPFLTNMSCPANNCFKETVSLNASGLLFQLHLFCLHLKI